MSDPAPTSPADQEPRPEDFATLERTLATAGPAAMFADLTESLRRRRRWHALFDARLLEARLRLGLPAGGDLSRVPEAVRQRLDEASLAACREVGWPLLEEGQVAAGWLYLRAAAEPGEVAQRLAEVAGSLPLPPDDDDEAAARRLHELVGVALWEGVDPAIGIDLVLRTQGTCNSITAYEQAVSRLPAARQQAAAGVLVRHLHDEVTANLAADLARRGGPAPDAAGDTAIAALLESAGGLVGDPSVHVDVSHLQSVLRIARVCTDEPTLRRAFDLARYCCRLPAEVTYPGEPPFENVGEASRHWYGAQLGIDVDAALAFFRRAAARARVEETGTLPADALAVLLWRSGRPAEALAAILERPGDAGMPSAMQAAGMLPSLLDIATAARDWTALKQACRDRGDEITFAAALVCEGQPPGAGHQGQSDPAHAPHPPTSGRQAPHSPT
jgi:hypothetical protein